MNFPTLKRAFYNSWQNIWRNKLISLSTLLLVGLILFIFNIFLHLHFVSHEILSSINQQIDMNLEIREDVNEFSVQALLTDLDHLDGIKSVSYIPKEEALIDFQKAFPDIDLHSFLEKFQEPNPLPSTIAIVSNDISYNDRIAEFLSQPKYQNIIKSTNLTDNLEEQNRIQRLENITSFVYQGGVFMNILFVLITMLIIFNAIKLIIFHHRQEIDIMRLVGATYSSIRLPFLIEGLAFGLFAFLLSIGCISFFLSKIQNYSEEIFIDLPMSNLFSSMMDSFQSNSVSIFTIEFLIVLLFTTLSSYIAIQSHLLKEEILS